jgi:hypothetical protein
MNIEFRPYWLIWSNEHNAWWGPGEAGYVTNRKYAGRYPFERACEIVKRANEYIANGEPPNEAMVRDD